MSTQTPENLPTTEELQVAPEMAATAQAIIARYPEPRSATLPLLHLIQENHGYISAAWMRWVAQLTGTQPIDVLGVVTFYPMFRQTPAGRRTIRVCRTLSCALRGSEDVMRSLENEFSCKRGETSPDGAVTLEFCECLANCGSGPNVQTDFALHENVAPNTVPTLAATIRASIADPALTPDVPVRTPALGSPEWNR